MLKDPPNKTIWKSDRALTSLLVRIAVMPNNAIVKIRYIPTMKVQVIISISYRINAGLSRRACACRFPAPGSPGAQRRKEPVIDGTGEVYDSINMFILS